MRARSAALALLGVALSSCATGGAPLRSSRTPLEARALESRSYAGVDSRLALKAVLGALQDEGFVVRTADAGLGLITATRETVTPPSAGAQARRLLLGGLALLVPGPGPQAWLLDATAHVSEIRDETRVRASFQLKKLEGDKTTRAETVTDAGFLQGFFARVDKALYLEREKL